MVTKTMQTRSNVQENTDDEIANIVNRIRDFQQDAESVADKIRALKDRLTVLLQERGANWSDAVGYARLLSTGTRISYDTESLDSLIITDPLRYGWLKDYRKESPVAGRITVK